VVDWSSRHNAGRVRKGFIRVGAGTDEVGNAGSDTPPIDGGVSIIMDKGYGGEDGVAGVVFNEGKQGCASDEVWGNWHTLLPHA
jgi:hypothetical protein